MRTSKMPCPGYEDLYTLYEDGKVYSHYSSRFVKPNVDKNGYISIGLYKGYEQKRVKLHRMLALAFIPNPDNKPEVNHKDGDVSNYDLSNLEWCTKSENILHSFRTLGKRPPKPHGQKHSMAALTNEQAVELRELYSTGEYRIKDLAALFGIGYTTANYIVNRRSYKDAELHI